MYPRRLVKWCAGSLPFTLRANNAVEGLTQSAALEGASFWSSASIPLPRGPTDTGMLTRFNGTVRRRKSCSCRRSAPQSYGDPEELAAAIVFIGLTGSRLHYRNHVGRRWRKTRPLMV